MDVSIICVNRRALAVSKFSFFALFESRVCDPLRLIGSLFLRASPCAPWLKKWFISAFGRTAMRPYVFLGALVVKKSLFLVPGSSFLVSGFSPCFPVRPVVRYSFSAS